MKRRTFLSRSGRTATITAVAASLSNRLRAEEEAAGGAGYRHSACRWCYSGIELEDLCVAGKEIGLESIELVDPGDLALLAKHGLTCAMVNAPGATTAAGVKVGGIERSFNRVEHHDALVGAYEERLKAAANGGAKQVICFSGNRDGLADEQGIENCAIGLKRILPTAEKLGLTVVMELLNSKVDHRDYQCDHTAWGVELSKRLDSPNFKLLYDIYHMQIMEGDVIATIRDNHQHICHYHTGGVPGRHEIDDTQELNYPAIMRAISDTGYTGFVGQEFIPARPDKLASLKQGVEICSV
ncbi:hydroxypyruvate isomerase [Haloferula helveola]|uniref:Hydroxypyruvate isomerase n=1 Tax=Haloferula helveola TaxID=490095 RepID=A0ABM7RDB5_9BACT|nr:hydroxypyruvate isomerase [Haloferula helveola]